MKILFIGGTKFVGRHTVQNALDRGHQVELFHRGKTGSDLFQGKVRHILGDRDGSLLELERGSWDAVIDMCGYRPAQVRKSAEFLRSRAPKYLFVSTISVYGGPGIPDENTPAMKMPESEDPNGAITGETYGPMKALCEEAVQDVYGDQAGIFRLGLQMGPFDHTDRFGDWVERIATRSEVAVPGGEPIPWQLIDARDTGRFMLDCLESGNLDRFILNGEARLMPEVLNEIRALLNPSCKFIEIASDDLMATGLEPWTQIPLWIPEADRADAPLMCGIAKAKAAGLKLRPQSETIVEAWNWLKTLPANRQHAAGMPADVEEKLITAAAV